MALELFKLHIHTHRIKFYLNFHLLDMCDLCVTSVVSADTHESLSFEELTPDGAFGSVLAITLPFTCASK